MAKIDKVKYLIIGNSAGGIGAAEAIREIDKAGAMAIVSDEPYSAYSRPLISEYLAKKRSLDKMLFRPADFYEKNDIGTFLGMKAARLDVDKRTIELENGRKIAWQKLLLATGGVPVVPRINGTDLNGVFTFTTLDDAKAIDQFLSQNRTAQAVVIGGGLIGVSVTEALVKRGVEVTVVEMQERILSTILDEETSALEVEAIRRSGVEVITGRTVTKVSSYRAGDATGVTLDDGRPIPCNLVIVAVGVRPRTELISGTGIKINRGIVVDHHLATSCPDIYACGDVAEAYDFVYDDNRLTPIWPNAYFGGRTAGLNMAGVPTHYHGGTALNSLKYFGINTVSAGIVTPPDGNYEVLIQKNGASYHKVVLKDGLVVGLVFTGKIEKSGILFSLIKNRVNVTAFKQTLTADDFGLAFLPEEIWREQLELPSSGSVSTVTSLHTDEEIIAGE